MIHFHIYNNQILVIKSHIFFINLAFSFVKNCNIIEIICVEDITTVLRAAAIGKVGTGTYPKEPEEFTSKQVNKQWTRQGEWVIPRNLQHCYRKRCYFIGMHKARKFPIKLVKMIQISILDEKSKENFYTPEQLGIGLSEGFQV